MGFVYKAGTGITKTGNTFSIGQSVSSADTPAFVGLGLSGTLLFADVGLTRNAANRVEINTGTPGTLADIIAKNFILQSSFADFDGGNNRLDLASAFVFRYSSTTAYSGTKDLGWKRVAAGVLQITDGSSGYGAIRCANLQVNNSASATVAVGTLAKKIEVFDAAGSSLGFIPVYATIT